MISFVKEILAPSIFTKGLLRYKRHQFEYSRKLILKAGKWMPDFKNDNFYNAALLVVESKLGHQFPIKSFEDAFESIRNSPYKGTNDYSVIFRDLKEILLNT